MNPLYGLSGIATSNVVSYSKKKVAAGRSLAALFEKKPKLHMIASRAALKRKGLAPYIFTDEDKQLFARLTTLQGFRMHYDGKPHGELFIHWFYCDRRESCLSRCEIFHLNMLQRFDVMDRVETIHVRCASTLPGISSAMEQAIAILSSGKAKVDFQIVSPKSNWEHDTIKEAVEYAAATGKFIYYLHFKGVSRIKDDGERLVRRGNLHPLDVLYWCYIMYLGLFSKYPDMPAIGPIACDRVNKEYLLRDLSWSTNPTYQYIGSFQAFDGKALQYAFDRLGLDRAAREKLIWWGGKYTVEMFLALVFLEEEVHPIAQMEGENSAYHMYTRGFCPSIKKAFKSLYSSEVQPFPPKGDGVAVCAIARNENQYLEEWVEHYKKLGVSHIYLYDNNDGSTETLEKLGHSPFITVIPVYGEQGLKSIGYQVGAYTKAYHRYGHLYEWMGFFDIDEFVSVDEGDIPQFLSQSRFFNVHTVHLHWRYHGDNGHVRGSPRPVQERFAEPCPIGVRYANPDEDENRYVKSFVRTGYDEMKLDVHAPNFFGALCRGSMGKFELPTKPVSQIEWGGARVEHYGTKSIEEYMCRRIPDLAKRISPNGACPDRGTITAKDRLDWFFRVNEVTQEKLDVIREMLPGYSYIPPSK